MIKYIGIGANELDTYLDYAVLSIAAIYLFDATPTEMGGLGACFALPFLFSSNFFGHLLDNSRIHYWRVFLFSMNAIITPVFMLTGSIYGLYCIAALKTLSRCGLNISNVKLNDNDSESQRFYEIYGYLINISRIFIPLIGVFIYQTYGLWHAVALSCALNVTGIIASTEKSSRIVCVNTNNNKGGIKFSFWNELKIKHELLYLVAGYTFANLAFFMSNDMLGLFFRNAGESEKSIGLIISLLGVGGFAGTKFATMLNKYLKPMQILLVSMIFNITAFAMFGFIPHESVSIYLFYSGIVLVGAASGITFFAVRFGVRNIIGYRDAGKATGMIQMLSSVVAILMPVVGGIIASITSLAVTFRLTSFLLLGILVVLLNLIYIRNDRSIPDAKPTKNE